MVKLKNLIRKFPYSIKRILRYIYLKVLDSKDVFTRKREDLIPPRSVHSIGYGDYKVIGERYFSHFINKCSLGQKNSVLDIGCGSGRMAVPLLKYLDKNGKYTGFDISKKAIFWCQKNITKENKSFKFYHADLYNKMYNPRGNILAEDYCFPCENASIDLAIAISVFTHMKPVEVLHYMKEVKRVLTPSGKALFTFFIIDKSFHRQNFSPDGTYDFKYRFKDYFSIDKNTHEVAIGYSEDIIRNLLKQANLTISEPIYHGCWAGRESMLDFQDVVIVENI